MLHHNLPIAPSAIGVIMVLVARTFALALTEHALPHPPLVLLAMKVLPVPLVPSHALAIQLAENVPPTLRCLLGCAVLAILAILELIVTKLVDANMEIAFLPPLQMPPRVLPVMLDGPVPIATSHASASMALVPLLPLLPIHVPSVRRDGLDLIATSRVVVPMAIALLLLPSPTYALLANLAGLELIAMCHATVKMDLAVYIHSLPQFVRLVILAFMVLLASHVIVQPEEVFVSMDIVEPVNVIQRARFAWLVVPAGGMDFWKLGWAPSGARCVLL